MKKVRFSLIITDTFKTEKRGKEKQTQKPQFKNIRTKSTLKTKREREREKQRVREKH